MLRAPSLLFVPVALGSAVMFAAQAPRKLWAAHLAMGLLALAMYALTARGPRLSERALAMQVALAVGAILCTLVAPGIEGVHRWLTLGSVRVHPSALLSPPLLVLAAAYVHTRTRLVTAGAAAVQLLHIAQPDAGQATAWAAAGAVLYGSAKLDRPRIEGLLVVTAGALLSWLNPDPLAGAPFVEDIVPRAFALAPWLGTLALASLLAAILAPTTMPPPRSAKRGAAPGAKPATTPDSTVTHRAALALAVYLAATFAVTAVGQFPVPLLGFGMSTSVGPFLGLAVLKRLKAHQTSEASAS